MQTFISNINSKIWKYEFIESNMINSDGESMLMTTCKVKNDTARMIWDCIPVVLPEI